MTQLPKTHFLFSPPLIDLSITSREHERDKPANDPSFLFIFRRRAFHHHHELFQLTSGICQQQRGRPHPQSKEVSKRQFLHTPKFLINV